MRIQLPRIGAILTLVLSGSLLSHPAYGQGGLTTATVSGAVRDKSSGALPGVLIEAANVATGQIRTTESNATGSYKLEGLAPGAYTVSYKLPAFTTQVRSKITLEVGNALTIDVVMEVGNLEETINVTADVPLIQSEKTDLSTVINQEQIASLPTVTRNYLDFTLQTPGVVQNVSSPAQGIGVNIGGARDKEAALVVDGFWNTDESFTFPRQLYSLDSIAEFQVAGLAPTAEFGRAMGGIVSAVTKSGTNVIHGSAYEYARTTGMTSQDPLSKSLGLPKSTFDRYQYGGSIGGPIKKDRVFFFGALEGLNQSTPQNNSITPANATAIGLPADEAGDVNVTLTTGFGIAKLDYKINDANNIGFKYVQTNDYDLTPAPPAFATESRRNRLNSVNHAFQFSWTKIGGKSGTWLQQLNVWYFPRDYTLDSPDVGGPPIVPVGSLRSSLSPKVTITNVAAFGYGGIALNFLTKPTQVVYSSNIAKGQHDIKFGVDIMYTHFEYISFPGPQSGAYSFSSLANFQIGKYSTYTELFGTGELPLHHIFNSYYVQDSWRKTQRLTFNYGLRYDVEWLSDNQTVSYGHDPLDFAPRFGVSYDMSGNGTTVFKLGTALIYDRLFLNPVTPTYLSSEYLVFQATAQFAFGQAGAPTYPNTLPNQSPAGLPLGTRNVYIPPSDLKVPRSAQAIVSVDHQFSRTFATTISGVFNRGWDKETLLDTNEVYNGSAFVRPNPTYLQIRQYNYNGKAEYEGLVMDARARGGKFQFNGDLTVARCRDQGDNWNSQVNDPRNPSLDYAPCVDTPTARFTANGVYNPNDQIGVSAILQAQSGRHYSAVGPPTSSFLGDNFLGDRVPGTTRSQFQIPASSSLDLRLTYTPPLFKEGRRVQATFEVFNVFNRANVSTVNTLWGADPTTPISTFGSPLAYTNPREIQVGLRFVF